MRVVRGAIDAATIQMAMTPDQTTFVFNPDAYLGSASADTGYTVELYARHYLGHGRLGLHRCVWRWLHLAFTVSGA